MVYKLAALEVIGFDSRPWIEEMMLRLKRHVLAHLQQLQQLPIDLVLNLLQIYCAEKPAEVEMLDEYILLVPPIGPIITNLER